MLQSERATAPGLAWPRGSEGPTGQREHEHEGVGSRATLRRPWMNLRGPEAAAELRIMAPRRVSATPPGLTCVSTVKWVLESSPSTRRMILPPTMISIRK